tara:strand:+ start:111 stop:305 length:195 start_codon:yes stop_codon:yes gene_type:complete
MREATKAEYLKAAATPHATKRIMEAGRTQDVVWSLCGREIAHKTVIFTRKNSNKVQSESFMVAD